MSRIPDSDAVAWKERLLIRLHAPDAFIRLCKAAGVYRGPESPEELKSLVVREVTGEYQRRLERLREEAALQRRFRPRPTTLADGESHWSALSGEMAFTEALLSAGAEEVAKGIEESVVRAETEIAHPVINALGQVVGYVDLVGRIEVRGVWNPVRFLEMGELDAEIRDFAGAPLGMRRIWEDEVCAAVWVEMTIPSFYELLKRMKGFLHYLNRRRDVPYRPIVLSPDGRHRRRFAMEGMAFVTPEEAGLGQPEGGAAG